MEISYQNIPEYKIFKEEFCVDNCNIGYFEYSFIENDCIYIDYIYINSNYRGNSGKLNLETKYVVDKIINYQI